MSNRFQEFRVQPDRGSGLEVSHVLAGLVLLVAVAALVTDVERWLWVGQLPTIAGQYWRLVTYGFTSSSVLSALISAVVLFLVTRGLQAEVAPGDLVGLFVLGGMAAATAHLVFGPVVALDGAICAIFAVFAGYAMVKHKAGLDIRGDIILLTLLIVWGILGGGQTWIGQLAAVAAGAALGWAHTGAWRGRQRRVRLTAAGLAVGCAVVATLVWFGPLR